MRLSEAIRKGSVGKRQIVEALTDFSGGVCAMGAAIVAVNAPMASSSYPHAFPWVAAASVGRCPACDSSLAERHPVRDGHVRFELTDTVIHLNNVHRWTFEQIADWAQAQEAIAGIGVEAEVSEPVLA